VANVREEEKEEEDTTRLLIVLLLLCVVGIRSAKQREALEDNNNFLNATDMIK
jgi:hypothetical protein